MRNQNIFYSLSDYILGGPRSTRRNGLHPKPPSGRSSVPRTSIAHDGVISRVNPWPVSEAPKVTVRLRGDCEGMVQTTTVTFYAVGGLVRQIETALNRHFGVGAVGIATPGGKVITEDYQVYRLRFPGHSYTFCNVVYNRRHQDEHPPITVPSQKILVEVSEDDVDIEGGERIRYVDPEFNYSTTYTDSAGLFITKQGQHEYQKQLAIQRGDYYVPSRDLPSYDCVPVRSSSRVGDACFSCTCCRDWIAHLLEEYGGKGLENMASKGSSTRRKLPGQRRCGQLNARDFDGLSLEQRRRLVRARGSDIVRF